MEAEDTGGQKVTDVTDFELVRATLPPEGVGLCPMKVLIRRKLQAANIDWTGRVVITRDEIGGRRIYEQEEGK